MNKSLIVARHELLTMLNRVGFRIMTLFVPGAMLLLLVGIGVYISIMEDVAPESRRFGYVDLAGVITGFEQQGTTTFHAFTNEEEARDAVAAGDISAAYIIPANYLQTGLVISIVKGESGLDLAGGGGAALQRFLRANLVAGVADEARAARIRDPAQTATITIDESGEPVQESFDASRAAFFMAVAFGIIFSVLTITGYLLQGLNEEKENRVMEILLSSITPDQLMLGKLLGLGAAGIVQMGVWVVSLVVFLIGVTRIVDGFPAFDAPSVPLIIIAVIYFLLGYAFFAALMAALGAITTSQRESQQVTFIVILPAVAPFWLIVTFIENPDMLLARVLTYVPFTAPTMSLARLGLDAMGTGEIILSLIALTLSVLVAVKLTQRLFRSYLLVYGHRPPLRQVVRTIVTGRV